MNVQASISAATEPDSAILLREDRDGICVLTLNRADARNPLSEAMLAALSQSLAAVAADASLRSVVIAARGPAFSAGHDLKELTAHRADADGGRSFFRRVMESCSAVMQQIVRLPLQ